MSLKALHIVFVVASIVLAFGLGAWALKTFSEDGARSYLWYGIGSLLAGVGLIFYCRAVLKKLKNVSYL